MSEPIVVENKHTAPVIANWGGSKKAGDYTPPKIFTFPAESKIPIVDSTTEDDKGPAIEREQLAHILSNPKSRLLFEDSDKGPAMLQVLDVKGERVSMKAVK